MQGINAQMPITAFLECEGRSFRIKSGHVTEAICRSFDAQVTFAAFERYEASTFLGKFCTLTVEDCHGTKRAWVGECQSLTCNTDGGGKWEYGLVFESILTRLKKTQVHFRTYVEVDLKEWVKTTFKRHGIESDSLEWRFNFREVRPRLVQVLQSDYDFLLKILAQENIIMWPACDNRKICFANDPSQWKYGELERIFYTGENDLIQHGGEKIGVSNYYDIHQQVRSADEEDAKKDWENKSPDRLYSGVPYLLDGMGGPALKPCKVMNYDQKSMQALFRRRETSKYEGGEVYRYLDASSNAIEVAVGNWISVVDVAKSEETRGRISYVKHEFTSEGKTVRYKNRFLLQPAMALWRGVSPLKPTLPLVMQAYIEGNDSAPSLNAFGEEQISFPGDAAEKPVPFEIPRMRSYVNHQGGMSFPLAHRTEVLISFLYGEADLPIIVGAVPNADTPSPVNELNPLDHVLSTRSGHKLRLHDDPKNASVSLETSPSHGLWMQNGKGLNLRSDGGFVMDVQGRILCQIGKTWNMLAGGSMTCTAGLSQTFETTKGSMTISSPMDLVTTVKNSMTLYLKSHMKMRDKNFKMKVDKDATITVKTGDARYQIKGAVSIQGGKGIRIVGGERLVLQSGNEGSGLIIEPGEITMYGKNLIGIEADAVELNGVVSYGSAPRVSSPVQALNAAVEEEISDELKKLIMHEINVYGPTQFYGETIYPGDLKGLLYMVSTEAMSIDTFVKSLYEDPTEQKKANIVEVNPHLKGCIEPGQMVFVADPKSTVYQRFGKSLRICAEEIEFVRKTELPEDASAFAKQYALMASFGESVGRAPGMYSAYTTEEDSFGFDDAGGMIIAGLDKYIRDQIKELKEINDAYKNHPKSKELKSALAKAFKEMDYKTVELLNVLVKSENLTAGKVLDASIRMQVGVHEWIPTEKKLVPISDQYKSALKVGKIIRFGGPIMIGYDAGTTFYTIYDACTIENQYHCEKTAYEESGGLAGRLIGGTAGGAAGTYVAGLAMALTPAGASVIVGAVVFAVAGYVGSEIGGKFGKRKGAEIFETNYKIGGQ